MNRKDDCIYLKCRYLKVLKFSSKEIELRLVFDQCALKMIYPLWGCSPNCPSYEKRIEIENYASNWWGKGMELNDAEMVQFTEGGFYCATQPIPREYKDTKVYNILRR